MNLLTKSIIEIDLSHKGAGPCGAIKRLINMNIIYPKTGRQDQLKVKARVIVDRDNEGIDMGKPGLSSGVKSLAAIQCGPRFVKLPQLLEAMIP
jgi:hypothetical protein